MANYGENYRAGHDHVICPLCSLHIDSQFLCLECPVIKSEIGSKYNIDDLYSNQISSKTVKILQQVNRIREEKMDMDNIDFEIM